MHRFYTDQWQNQLAVLAPEDEKHAFRVLRLSPGDQVELISLGKRYLAVLREGALLEPLSPLPSTEANLRITLFQGLPKGDKMDWIIQKAVEIGVARVVPVMMDRCVIRLQPQDLPKKQARWARIAREAGKQSGRAELPEVTLPIPLSQVPGLASGLDLCIVPWEDAHSSGPLSIMRTHPDIRSAGILIGPEGGIDPSEIDLLRNLFHPITLGPRILRTETAGLVTAAAILALAGEMEGMS